MTESTEARLRGALVAIGPSVLLIAFLYHPYVATPTDEADIAAAVAADTTRWGIAHIGIAVGYGLITLAFLVIRAYLRQAGEERWSRFALAGIAFGGTLFAILTGMEFAPLAAVDTGGDPAAVQSELVPWFVPILAAGAISFTLGAVGFALAISAAGVLSPRLMWLVASGLVVMAAARFLPLGIAQPIIGFAGVAALWPLAYNIARNRTRA